MAAPTDTFIDPADGAAAGNDHGGNAFVDGSFANATNTLTRVGAFTAATTQAGDKIYLDDNGSGEVAAGLYTISVRTDDDNIVLTADIRSGAPDPTDVRCDQHTGAVGLPWATVQHALDFVTRDAANGDRFNVKNGTDDVLAAALDFSTYGTPTAAAPWILQGYSAAAEDGGIGGVSGGGAVGIVGGDALDFLYFIDMHLHNTGANDIISIDNNNAFINCEIDNTTLLALDLDSSCIVINCYIHNCDGIVITTGGVIAYNTFEHITNQFTFAIQAVGPGSMILFNVIDMALGVGILVNQDYIVVLFNSIYSTAGTGAGIRVPANSQGAIVMNNICEGFSGVGGIGIEIVAGAKLAQYGFNAFFNNTTNLSNGGDLFVDLSANDQVLGASPFTNAAADDFTVDTSVRALAYLLANYPSLAVRSYLDIGALQRQEAGGGIAAPICAPSAIAR